MKLLYGLARHEFPLAPWQSIRPVIPEVVIGTYKGILCPESAALPSHCKI